MSKFTDHSSKFRRQRKSLGLQLNKLQALSCLAACMGGSVILLLWGVKTFG